MPENNRPEKSQLSEDGQQKTEEFKRSTKHPDEKNTHVKSEEIRSTNADRLYE